MSADPGNGTVSDIDVAAALAILAKAHALPGNEPTIARRPYAADLRECPSFLSTMTESTPPGGFSLRTAKQAMRATSSDHQQQIYPIAQHNYHDSTFGVPSASLPHLETVPATIRQQIIEGKDVNLALLLFPSNDLRQVTTPQGELLLKSTSDPRANKILTISEFIEAFSKYRNIMCEVYPERRVELDRYLRDIVSMQKDFQGALFYEYHKAFSARAAAALQQLNVKIDWSVRDNNIFCSVFAGHKVSSCRLCGSISHRSEFCSLLANPDKRGPNVFSNFSQFRNPAGSAGRGQSYGAGGPKSFDVQGRRRIHFEGTEICNYFNSTRGCFRPQCSFVHNCSQCRGQHPATDCHKMPGLQKLNNSGRSSAASGSPASSTAPTTQPQPGKPSSSNSK